VSHSPNPSVASTAIAAGEPAVASSFRFHRPRGPLCARGYCFQCEITTDPGTSLACQTASNGIAPRPARDRLRPFGRVAERFPPWFYERRFMHPSQVTAAALHALRYLSAAPRLDRDPGSPTPRPPRSYVEREARTAVVGPAGVADDAYRVDLDQGSLALGVYPGRILGVLEGDQLTAVHFERLILATGSYERLPPIPGNDLPGVLGLRALEIYGTAGGLRPGMRIAAWGPARAQERVQSAANRHGLTIVWMSDAGDSRQTQGKRDHCRAARPLRPVRRRRLAAGD
jgi:hypothetical protein